METLVLSLVYIIIHIKHWTRAVFPLQESTSKLPTTSALPPHQVCSLVMYLNIKKVKVSRKNLSQQEQTRKLLQCDSLKYQSNEQKQNFKTGWLLCTV